MMNLVFPAIVAFLVALGVTPAVRMLAWKAGVVDRPVGPRKLHGREVALLGGLAIYLALVAGIIAALWDGSLPSLHVHAKFLVGIVTAATFLVFGGAIDDAKNISPVRQLLWPLLAVSAVIISGIGVTYVTNPFGGQIFLDRISWNVLWFDGLPYKLTLVADVFTVVWLMGMTYTTKLLDGMDGLVSGVTVIGGLVIAAVSLTRDVAQPDTAVLAFIIAGAFLGFFFFNASPAGIFLGEGGSTLAGFMLGLLAIISGGKIATALLVLGLPLVDAATVIIRRLISRRPVSAGDRSHLHFRLQDLGFTPAQITLFYCFVAALFGTSTLILQGWEKVAALSVLGSILFAGTAAWAVMSEKEKH